MKNKTTWIFALLVLAMAAYSYFIEFKGSEKKEKLKQEQAKIYSGKLEEIVSISSEGKEWFQVQRVDSSNDWKLIAPIEDQADSSAVELLLKAISDEKSEEVVAEGADLKFEMFGLEKTAHRIRLKLKAGTETTYAISSETGVGGKRFLRIDKENKVHLIGGGLWTQSEKPIGEIRSKQFFSRVAGDVQSFSILNRIPKSPEVFSLESKESKWRFSKAEYLVDKDALDRFFGRLRDRRASQLFDIPKNEKAAGGKYGLEPFQSKIQIVFVGGAELTLTLGTQVGKDKKRYLQASNRSPLFEVTEGDLEVFNQTVASFRDKKFPFVFDKSKVVTIDLKTTAAEVHFKKVADKWESVAPLGDKEVAQNTVGVLLNRLNDLQVSKFFGTQKPKFFEPKKGEVALKDGDGKVLLSIQWGEDKKENINPIASGATKEFFGVEPSMLAALPGQSLIKDKAPLASAAPVGEKLPTVPAPTRVPETKQ